MRLASGNSSNLKPIPNLSSVGSKSTRQNERNCKLKTIGAVVLYPRLSVPPLVGGTRQNFPAKRPLKKIVGGKLQWFIPPTRGVNLTVSQQQNRRLSPPSTPATQNLGCPPQTSLILVWFRGKSVIFPEQHCWEIENQAKSPAISKRVGGKLISQQSGQRVGGTFGGGDKKPFGGKFQYLVPPSGGGKSTTLLYPRWNPGGGCDFF